MIPMKTFCIGTVLVLVFALHYAEAGRRLMKFGHGNGKIFG
jgi:hypothetical protein